MDNWKHKVAHEKPCWADYRSLVESLPGRHFPTPRLLNQQRPEGLVSGSGLPLRFVPASDLPGVAYEKHIFETGEVSTRESNWHDLFNALVWLRLPRIKAAMNGLHHGKLSEARDGNRGALRDALTLLDESGALVISHNAELLAALGARDWRQAFVDLKPAWATESKVIVCGHALLEKFLDPYKAITAHVLLLRSERRPGGLSLPGIDEAVARGLLSGGLLRTTASLSPLPLMGIPGWWGPEKQDEAFYADRQVFRAPANSPVPAPARPLCL